jgi:PD-(D/E)XK nuclease superfamily protein
MTAGLCELRVFSRRHGFAGTLDVLGRWRGSACVVDYKTGSPADVGASWQTAAYVGALHEMRAHGEAADRLTFDPVGHRYALEGVGLPSVTQVLQAVGIIDFSGIPQPILLAARDRGSAVHAAAHYYNENDLDVEAFAAEFPGYWPYLEAWITFRRESGFALAYALDELGPPGAPIARYAIELRKDGTYRVHAYRAASDYAEFLTLLRASEIVARHRGERLAEASVA